MIAVVVDRSDPNAKPAGLEGVRRLRYSKDASNTLITSELLWSIKKCVKKAQVF